MFGSQVLEVAIGLVCVYLVLSVICSGIKEAIAGTFSMRSRTLEAAIGNMLNDPSDDLAQRFFAHPLINRTARPGDKPSYISSSNFAIVLFELLSPGSGAQPMTIQALRTSIGNMPDCALRKIMLGFLETAQGDLDAFRKRVESWFDDTMQRVSGWYKRKAQIIIFAAGILVCALLNADTFMVVKQLWSDQALRNMVVAEATAEASLQNRVSSPMLGQVQEALQTAKVPPIGWALTPGDTRGFPHGAIAWFEKVLGILFSVVAVSMGAPFWFDMVNKFINVRLSGGPPPPQH
jgi:hypothetical protein